MTVTFFRPDTGKHGGAGFLVLPGAIGAQVHSV